MNNFNSIIILGPTGSGKTELSINLAKELDGEIINADSMQIYKELNIGTAKPSVLEMQGIPHHLFDFLEPSARYSVSEYRKDALKVFNDLLKRKKTPIIIGGTGFYIDSLLNNFSYGNSKADMNIRKKYEDILEKEGKEYLYDLLKECDSTSANRIHINDTKRVIRALEIFELSKIEKSEHIKIDNENKVENNIVKPLIIGLNYNREELYERINRRVDIMVKKGLIDEAKMLYSKYGNNDYQSLQAIGYKELFESFENKITLDEAIENIKQSSRRYAKRQITWFKRNKDIILLNKSEISQDEILKQILVEYEKH